MFLLRPRGRDLQYKDIGRELVILLGAALIAAFTVNHFSPKGIALVGQWVESQGVITAKAKDDIVLESLEIEDVKIAKQIYDTGKAIFVDARPLESYEDGHIKGAVSFPVWQFDEYIDGFRDQFTTADTIVTYCSGRTCDDSHRLAQLLFEEGYTNVVVFIDGYPGWDAEGYPIE
jgi:rhodanese-related sulfurtransferase